MSKSCCDPGPKSSSKTSEGTPTLSSIITSFKVRGMDCSDEVSAIQRALSIPLVLKVDTNLINETITVYHEKGISPQDIHKLVEKTGVKIVQESQKSFFSDHSSRILLISFSGFFLGLGLIFDWIELQNNYAIIGTYVLSILLAGIIIFPKAWRSISKFHLDMNVLMTVAAIGAFLIKEYSEAASVVFLFSFAELLEALSVSRARKAIQEVLKITPKEAMQIKNDGKLKSVRVEELEIGSMILVRPGENIPVDGKVIEGQSSVNQASLTGESKPVGKKVDDSVWAGTINESGVLTVLVEKSFQDTKISKIISLIEEAQSQKAPSQRFVDHFSSIYTPAIMILAIFVCVIPPLFLNGNWDDWIYKALVLLVIGCPCALVIATPISVVSGLTSLARRGILVKGGVHLESLGKLKAMALDKTGTITNGKPEVMELKVFGTVSEAEVIRLTASLESHSTHPLAKAILNFAQIRGQEWTNPSDYKNIVGKGAEGKIDEHEYFIGNHQLAHELGICSPAIEQYLDSVESRALSVVVLGHKPHQNCKGEILGIFSVGDSIRPNIKDAISGLHSVGIQKVVMLSGDNQKTVNSIAGQVGIDEAMGALLPDNKVDEIKKLVAIYKYVGMVGDGVNDAPALAHATIGIAMGVAGSDTAIETADVALMKDDLFELPKAIAHGRRVLSIIRFNILFALAIKAVFLVLALLGLTNLWLAVASDAGASLLVTFNALRLLKIEKI